MDEYENRSSTWLDVELEMQGEILSGMDNNTDLTKTVFVYWTMVNK